MLNSKRKYQIATIEAYEFQEKQSLTIYDLCSKDDDSDTEVKYALQDIGDKVLDMKIGDSLYFQPNRDDKKTKGIILRTA